MENKRCEFILAIYGLDQSESWWRNLDESLWKVRVRCNLGDKLHVVLLVENITDAGFSVMEDECLLNQKRDGGIINLEFY